jgi:hypothetical protein
MNAPGGDYNSANLVLPGPTPSYDNSAAVASLVPALDTSSWYKANSNCIRTDPTLISRRHTFPDAPIPRGIPQDPFGPSRICSDTTCSVPVSSTGVGCTQYKTAWPQQIVDPTGMIETAMNHPQFAFRVGGPGTQYQLDVESQLRRLDQPLGNCQAIIPEDAPLYRNTVAPPPPVGVPEGVQNAANPVAAMIRSVGAEQCRIDADTVATAMSGRRFWNPTRQDTMRFDLPFAPPGIGTGAPRPRQPPVAGTAFYS